jgi:hypothetical protein
LIFIRFPQNYFMFYESVINKTLEIFYNTLKIDYTYIEKKNKFNIKFFNLLNKDKNSIKNKQKQIMVIFLISLSF